MEIDFQKLVANKSDIELQNYIKNRSKYTDEAIGACIAEIEKRGITITTDEINVYHEELKQKIEAETNNETKEKKASQKYWFGLLGLIPLIGAFVGLVLILLGIFRYKDKILVGIGAVCILFTIGVYSSLFYSMKNSSFANEGFATISQMQINGLVKNIEFYKLQNGTYPENIEKIKGKDALVQIIDPLILSKSNNSNMNYRYEKIGDKYNLHSVGVDLIDNTEDDLYPTLENLDNSKLGFIKKGDKK